MTAQRTRRSDRFLKVLTESPQVLVVAHDNPDPDAIASGWAILRLIRRKLDKPVRLIAGGAVVRAENRHMLTLLEPPIELVHEVDVTDATAVVLVDCGVSSENIILSGRPVRPVAVIDHHPPPPRRARLRFQDIRPKVAATASIAASYLREQAVEPGPELATALLYAVRTETRAYETYHSRVDRSIIAWLTPQADPTRLAEIESAPLSQEYFGDLALALERTFVYDKVAICLLPRGNGPEIVGEVADLLIRCESVECVLCGALIGNDLLVSVRTQDPSENAADFVRAALAGLGRGGGHAYRAGGKIPGAAKEGKIPESLSDRLRSQWLDVCNVDRQRGTRLIAKREIIENL